MRVTDAVGRRPELGTESSKTSYPSELHGKTGPARHCNKRLPDETCLSFRPALRGSRADSVLYLTRCTDRSDREHASCVAIASACSTLRPRTGRTTFVSSDRWHVRGERRK